MHIMIILMLLPVLGIILFFVLPFSQALPSYLLVLAFSAFFYVLMFRSMRKPRQKSLFEMVGESAQALDWSDGKGQVLCLGAIWEARSEMGGSFPKGTELTVSRVEGLTLVVKASGGEEAGKRAPEVGTPGDRS